MKRSRIITAISALSLFALGTLASPNAHAEEVWASPSASGGPFTDVGDWAVTRGGATYFTVAIPDDYSEFVGASVLAIGSGLGGGGTNTFDVEIGVSVASSGDSSGAATYVTQQTITVTEGVLSDIDLSASLDLAYIAGADYVAISITPPNGNSKHLNLVGMRFQFGSTDGDTDPTNELNTAFTYAGTTISITDAGGTLSADLSSLEESADIAANAADIAANAADIASNAADIGANTSAIASNSADIAANAADIASNAADIASNSTAIADNAADIATNAADIASNSTAIADNAADIASNSADIASNSADIAANASDIAANASDIAANASDIAANALSIADNSADIASNSAAIASNASDIANNSAAIASNTSDIANNSAAIATNASNIASNTSAISAHVAADNDLSATNELQSWSTLPGIPAGFTDGVDNVNDADSNPTNELQSLSLSGTTLSISSGNAVNLAGVGADNLGNHVATTNLNLNGNVIFNAQDVFTNYVSASIQVLSNYIQSNGFAYGIHTNLFSGATTSYDDDGSQDCPGNRVARGFDADNFGFTIDRIRFNCAYVR